MDRNVESITNALNEFEKFVTQVELELSINATEASEEDIASEEERRAIDKEEKEQEAEWEEDEDRENEEYDYDESEREYRDELRGRKPLSYDLFEISDVDDYDLGYNYFEEIENDDFNSENAFDIEDRSEPDRLNSVSKPKDEGSSEPKIIITNFVYLLSELKDCLRQGDIKKFKFRLTDTKELLDNSFLSELLYERLGKYSDDISGLLFSIIDQINFEEFFENEIEGIPSNIRELTDEILFQISRNPELIYGLEPGLFEELIRKIFAKFKLQTTLTKKTRDGGIDILAFEDNMFSKNSYVIECKRYAPHKKVSIDIVQRLYGIKQSNRLTKAFLVTSSSFTKPAREWANQHCWELELKDFNDIVKWLNAFW